MPSALFFFNLQHVLPNFRRTQILPKGQVRWQDARRVSTVAQNKAWLVPMSRRTLGVQKPVSEVKANARGSMFWFDQVSKAWDSWTLGSPWLQPQVREGHGRTSDAGLSGNCYLRHQSLQGGAKAAATSASLKAPAFLHVLNQRESTRG